MYSPEPDQHPIQPLQDAHFFVARCSVGTSRMHSPAAAQCMWAANGTHSAAPIFEPTILTGVPTDSKLMSEETFGRVAPLVRFASESEVIARANDTEFGLASYLYTRDLARAWRVSEALEYGMVGLNT